jgi:PAS domain S-box-containing protein
LTQQKSLSDLVDDGIVVIDRNMKIVFANRTLLRWCSMVDAEITGIPCHMVFQQCLLPCSERCLHHEVLSTGRACTVTYTHKTPDGSKLVYEVNATPVLDEKGEIAQIVEVYRNITEEKMLENETRETDDFVHPFLNAFAGGMALIDRDMRVVMANKMFLSPEHDREEEVAGAYCYHALHKYPRPCSEMGDRCPAQNTFRTGLPSEVIHLHVDTGGKEHFAILKTYPVKNKNGKVAKVIETFQDITDKAENEIKERIRVLELKEEIEILREKLEGLTGSREIMSAVSSL